MINLEIVKDVYQTTKEGFISATGKLLKNWMLMFTGIIYASIIILGGTLINMLFFGVFSIIGGFAYYLLTCALISNYLYLLSITVNDGKIVLQDFKDGFKYYFSKVISVMFAIYVVRLIFAYLIVPILSALIPPEILYIGFVIVVFVLLNALPESIYQKRYAPLDTVTYAMRFARENWIEWFIPNIILSIVLYYLTGNFILDVFNIGISMGITLTMGGILKYLLAQFIFSFTMVFRGVLFEELTTTSRRKRMFKRNVIR